MSLEPFFKFLRAAQASFHGADAEVGEQRFLGILPGSLLIQAGEDAGAGGANGELAPGHFIRIFPNFPELEPLVQLC